MCAQFIDIYIDIDEPLVEFRIIHDVFAASQQSLTGTWSFGECIQKNGGKRFSFRKTQTFTEKQLELDSYPRIDADELLRDIFDAVLLKLGDAAALGEVLVAIYLYHPSSTAEISYSPWLLNAINRVNAQVWVDGYSSLSKVFPNHAAERYRGKRVSFEIGCAEAANKLPVERQLYECLRSSRVDIGLVNNGVFGDCASFSAADTGSVRYRVPVGACWYQFLETLVSACASSPELTKIAAQFPLSFVARLETDFLSWTFEMHQAELQQIEKLFSCGLILIGAAAVMPAGEELGRKYLDH